MFVQYLMITTRGQHISLGISAYCYYVLLSPYFRQLSMHSVTYMYIMNYTITPLVICALVLAFVNQVVGGRQSDTA